MSENSTPPAGWYPDPQNGTQQRYWDGAAWTQHVAPVAPVAAAPGAAVAAAPIAAPGQPAKKRLSTGAIVGIVVGAVVLLGLIVFGILFAAAVPVFNSQQGKAHDAAAKGDVSTLGKEIATYYVDHDGTPPKIVVEDGSYVFANGTPMSGPTAKSADVEFGGQSGFSWNDWCVWVTAPEGELKDFEYSAQHGLQQGRCEG